MQYEISGSVLAGQITTTTWAGAPSRTWAWPRAIGGAGRGIGGAGQFGSWTWAEAAVARATVPPRRSTLRWTCPRARLGRRQRSIGPGRAVDQGGSSSRRRPGRWLRRGPGRLSSRRSPGRRQRWPGPHGTPPGVQLCGGPAQGRALGEGSGRSGLGAPWTRAAQLATSAWAVAPSRTWA